MNSPYTFLPADFGAVPGGATFSRSNIPALGVLPGAHYLAGLPEDWATEASGDSNSPFYGDRASALRVAKAIVSKYPTITTQAQLSAAVVAWQKSTGFGSPTQVVTAPSGYYKDRNWDKGGRYIYSWDATSRKVGIIWKGTGPVSQTVVPGSSAYNAIVAEVQAIGRPNWTAAEHSAALSNAYRQGKSAVTLPAASAPTEIPGAAGTTPEPTSVVDQSWFAPVVALSVIGVVALVVFKPWQK